MNRQVLLLVTAQAFAQTASILVMTVGSLAGREIAPDPQLATVPISAMILGTVIATVPASMWMARAGRRVGFITGALLGTLGGLVAASGIVVRSFFVLLLGLFLIGTYQAFTLFYRFAASEVSDDAFRPRAISLVLTGGVAAALLGPALAGFGASLLERAYAGSFLILAAVSLAAAGVLLGLRVPLPQAQIGQSQPRPLLVIMRQPTFAVAIFAAATGGGVMVLAMTAMPLAMAQHHHGLSATTVVMQVHVLGMFLPSFFTGSLIARCGVLRVMFAGAVLLSAHVALSVSGTGFVWETAERYGKPGEDQVGPGTQVNIAESTFVLNDPTSERPWKFRGMEHTIGEFGAYERAPDVDTRRKPVEYRTPAGKLLLAVPDTSFDNGINSDG